MCLILPIVFNRRLVVIIGDGYGYWDVGTERHKMWYAGKERHRIVAGVQEGP